MLSGARFVGSTVHLVNGRVDAGLPIIQASYPRSASLSQVELRKRIFMQQCKSLVQVVRWYEEGRILVSDGFVDIRDATYEIDEFSPNIDFKDAKYLF
jgi:phosphoribosylglycinamide formyltransferase-1